jgi:CBS domain-containing protein
MDQENMLVAAPEASVSDAVRLLAGSKLGAVLVVERDRLAGIFTEHDAVQRVLAAGLDAHTTRLVDVMTPDPHTGEPDWTFGHALQLMHQHGLRHLPVVEQGRPVGLLCARDALDPDMEEFSCEVKRREAYVGETLAFQASHGQLKP